MLAWLCSKPVCAPETISCLTSNSMEDSMPRVVMAAGAGNRSDTAHRRCLGNSEHAQPALAMGEALCVSGCVCSVLAFTPAGKSGPEHRLWARHPDLSFLTSHSAVPLPDSPKPWAFTFTFYLPQRPNAIAYFLQFALPPSCFPNAQFLFL